MSRENQFPEPVANPSVGLGTCALPIGGDGLSESLPLFNTLPAMMGDRGYDSEPHRQGLREMGVEPQLAERNTENGSGLGAFRWVVERTLGWIHQNRRLRIRYERRPEIHQAFLTLACIKICASFLFDG
jgi:IS5 family transposase